VRLEGAKEGDKAPEVLRCGGVPATKVKLGYPHPWELVSMGIDGEVSAG
jgi:hypothetical protein